MNTARISLGERTARAVARFTASAVGCLAASAAIAAGLAAGALLGFDEHWQFLVNTTTTIVTFIAAFLIQRTQNKETLATQLKLNELVAASQGCSNWLMGLEHRPEEDLVRLHHAYTVLAQRAEVDRDPHSSHSVEECHSAAATGEDRADDASETRSGGE